MSDKIKDNIWEDNFDEVTSFIKEVTKVSQVEQYSNPNNWSWLRNPECKYIDIRIDMRDGGFVIKNRGGLRITFEELKKQ